MEQVFNTIWIILQNPLIQSIIMGFAGGYAAGAMGTWMIVAVLWRKEKEKEKEKS